MSHQFFFYLKLTFGNSQHEKTDSKGGFYSKTDFKRSTKRFFMNKIKSDYI